MSEFEYTSVLPATPAEVYDWHSREGALERLTPPWERIEIEGRVKGLRPGSRVYLRLRQGPLRLSWVAEHTAVEPSVAFADTQMEGPFRKWVHWHRFDSTEDGSCLLRDAIEYELPLGRLGKVLGQRYVSKSLERTFSYRHRTTADDMKLHQRYSESEPLRVAITGATGLVGSALTALLTTGGHQVVRLVRSTSDGRGSTAVWDPYKGLLEPDKLEDMDAVVHLAGESIANGRWTERRKERIRASRVEGTANLARSLMRLERPPRVFLCASAVGIYGDRGDELLDEKSSAGSGFLTDVCLQWEKAADLAAEGGMRVAKARTGVVLSPAAGALAKMLPAFRLGAGGRLGSGEQFMSWISIDDAAGALLHILMHPELEGPVNLVAPNPARNKEFTKVLAQVLGRPALVPMPALVAKALFGQMAEEALLASARVEPGGLAASGFVFRDPELRPALERLLGR
jgi:uncharacterized protein (TIGR01777 family)